jgi:hypothetical protein
VYDSDSEFDGSGSAAVVGVQQSQLTQSPMRLIASLWANTDTDTDDVNPTVVSKDVDRDSNHDVCSPAASVDKVLNAADDSCDNDNDDDSENDDSENDVDDNIVNYDDGDDGDTIDNVDHNDDDDDGDDDDDVDSDDSDDGDDRDTSDGSHKSERRNSREVSIAFECVWFIAEHDAESAVKSAFQDTLVILRH